MTEPRSLEPPLVSPSGERVAVVHLTAEYHPFARTGGLAEAVRGMAEATAASGVQVAVIMPLYRTVRDEAPDLEPVGAPFHVQIGSRTEEARIFRIAGRERRPEIYFIGHPEYFSRPGLYGEAGADYPDNPQRFAFFCLAAAIALPRLTPMPCVLHAHDWHTALALVYLRTRLGHQPGADRVATVMSVHNAGYQGYFGPGIMPEIGLPWELFNWQQLEWYGQVNLLKGGLAFSDLVLTVSPTHAAELRTPDGGFGLHGVFQALGDRFAGVLNGIDQSVWSPAVDRQITARYGIEDLEGKTRCKKARQRSFGPPQRRKVPLVGLTGRLVRPKGLDLILGSPSLLSLDAQFVFLGTGDPYYERALLDLAAAAPNKVGVQLDFTDRLEHRLMAGADLFLMPSQYEPCGLTQMRAQRYGALPIVRRVGGLADTVEDGVTGFMFDAYAPEAFEAAAFRALEVFRNQGAWTAMMKEAMVRDFSWERSTRTYLSLYRRVVSRP